MRKITQNLRNEPIFTQKWDFKPQPIEVYARDVLLTGPTTSIGIYVLSELLNIWPSRVHVLVNAKSIEEAQNMVADGLQEYRLPFYGFDRIVYHLGDPTQPLFGLKHNEYNQLKTEVGHFVHFAMSQFYKSSLNFYHKLWLPALENVIKFCGDSENPKTLHYKGTMTSSFFKTDKDFDRLETTVWHNSYSAFQSLSSQLINNTFKGGLKGAIYDIPMIIGSNTGGINSSGNSAWQIIDIFIKSGFYCKFDLRISCVRAVAKMIALNIHNSLYGDIKPLIRPVLKQFVRDRNLRSFAEKNLNSGLREGELEDIQRNYPDKEKVRFLIPEDFKELLNLIRSLDPIYPDGLEEDSLPDGREVFAQSIFQIFGEQLETLDI